MALVVDVNNTSTTEDPHYELVGIITLEDIMEQILGEDIMDETDFDEAEQLGLSIPGMEMDKREREMARLKMLSGKLADDKLTPEEVQAITSHLTTNVPQIERLLSGTSVLGTQAVTVDQIRQMVMYGCKVIEFTRKAHPDAVLRMEPASEDILYKRNKPSNVCTLILSGRVTVQAGKDQFRSEIGPWSLLGADSLELEDGEYVPDYTAFVSSDSVRCLVITKANMRKCWLGFDDVFDANTHRKRKGSRDKQNSAVKRGSASNGGERNPNKSPLKTISTAGEYGPLSVQEEEGGDVQGQWSGGEGLEMTESPLIAHREFERIRSNSLS